LWPVRWTILVSVELVTRAILPLSLLLILLAILESRKSTYIEILSWLVPHIIDFMSWFFIGDIAAAKIVSSTTDGIPCNLHNSKW